MSDGEGGVRFTNEVGSKFAANGSQESGRDQPARDGRQEWREEQQNQCDTDKSAAHGLASSIGYV